MSIEIFLAGCAGSQPDGEGQMVDAKNWDWMVWTTELKALTRYNYWREGHFKDGTMSQIAVVRVVLDLFHPEHNQIDVIASASHPFQKTVVYNKQDIAENVTTTIGKLLSAKMVPHYQPQEMTWDDLVSPHNDELS